MSDYRIRTMRRDELDIAVEWAAHEGWNPGLDDAAAFYEADPEGFLVGLLDGDPIAVISVVRYGPAFGFLGFYIVRPDRRGGGYGYRIWQAGMERLGARTIGLDGVVAQQANYECSGFVLAHRNVRHGGVMKGSGRLPEGVVEINAAAPADLVEAVLAYDRTFFAGQREAFMTNWLSGPGRRAVALIRDGRVAGYGVIRPCRSGYKIGPLFAGDEAGAEAIFTGLTAPLQETELFLDVPEPNAAAVALATRHGLAPVFETARMYRGPTPALPLERTFGITTFELG